MGDIIREWIINQIGETSGKQAWAEDRGGGIIAKLLNSYTLLTDEQVEIIFCQQGELYESTLEAMRLAITGLGIKLDKEEYQDVLQAKGNSITRLLYEMYLVLHDKDAMHFMLARKLNESPHSSRINVHQCSEYGGESESEKFSNPLAKSLMDKDEIVEYHINKYLDLMEKCKKSREVYLSFINEKRILEERKHVKMTVSESVIDTEGVKCEELPVDAESLNQSATELIKEAHRARRLPPLVPNKAVSKDIIKTIQKKSQKMHKIRESQGSYRKTILKNLWETLLEGQEEYFKNQFTEKLQQQSLYEQQITTCLINVRNKRDMIAEQKYERMAGIQEIQERMLLDQLMDEERKKDYERTEYYKEKQRKEMLHRNLYERKLKRKQARMTDECTSIMNDIVDIAQYTINYKETHCDDLPRRKRDDLARLFVAKQPIFNQVEDVSQVIDIDVSSSNVTSEDESTSEIITVNELDRQNAIDDLTFEDYHTFRWPWDYNCWMNFEYFPEMTRGLNVIGHIVHRLLKEKYQKKPQELEETIIPKTNVAACVLGLHNLDYLPALEQLLKARNIKIIQVHEAVTYCLSVFKKESTDEYIESVYKMKTESELKAISDGKVGKSKSTVKKGSKPSLKKRQSLKNESKSDKSSKSSKSKSKSKSLVDLTEPTDTGVLLSDKINQTPKTFPGEKLVLSSAACVGKDLFNTVEFGETPNENITARAVVEYLKTLDFNNLEGWVLINYPATIQQAVALEENLTHISVPNDFCDVPCDCASEGIDIWKRSNAEESSSVSEKHFSQLVENVPSADDDDLEYDTFLTAFIEMKSSDGIDPDEQYFDSLTSLSNKSILSQFYQDQGCKYTLYYETIDFATVKHLGKLILGDFSMPPKDSLTLFTDTINYVEANFDELSRPTTRVVKEGEKKTKRKKDKAKGSDKKNDAKTVKSTSSKMSSPKQKKEKGKKVSKSDKSSKKKSSKTSTEKIGKKKKKKGTISSTSGSGDVDEKEDKETQIPTPIPEPSESEESDLPPAQPGEYRWKYYDLPIAENFTEALATLWQNLEEVYICDMKQLFFRRRVLLDSLMPYNTYVKNNLLEYIARPDIKQKYLQDFQLVYNEFDDDMREDDEVKCELHMRIEEFREKLWKICDARMLENENERVRIVQDNWLTTLLIELCNIYSSFMQLEIDRCTDTAQLLIDYYSIIITKMPSPDPLMDKIRLDFIKLPSNIEDMDHVAPFVEHTEDLLLQSRQNIIAKGSPFAHKMEILTKNANDKLNSIKAECEKVKNRFQMKFNPKERMKSPRSSNKDSKITEPDEEVKHRAAELISELEAAYMGEYHRCWLRLKILEHVFLEEAQDVMEKGAGNFHALYEHIEARYRREMRAIDDAVRLLKHAVEEETKIQPELLLEGDMFYVKLGTWLYESPLPDDDSVPVREPNDDESFTVKQLMQLTEMFSRLAPNGIIAERAFVFLLQDLLVYQGEDGREDFVPKLWKTLEPHKTHTLVSRIFGETEYIDWKDFILYCLEIRFPDQNEILNIRQKFRNLDPDMTEFIYEHQYPDICFWFEADLRQPRLKYTRELLFRLYQVGERLNYTALLLACCKDFDPIMGLVKAIVVSIGKPICHDENRGSVRYAKSLKRIMRRELDEISRNVDRKGTEHMSKEIVDKLIDETIHRTNSAVLTALETEEVEPICSYDIIQYLQEPTPRPASHGEVSMEASMATMTEGENTTQELNAGSQGHTAVDVLEYQIPFDIILNIFNVMIPWIHKIRRFGELTFHERFALIYNSLINEDITIAYIYQILLDDDFLRMFEHFYRFCARDVSYIVRELLDDE